MPHVTSQLGNEPGIQYQGVKDASSKTSAYPSAGLIYGFFRRGRFDKPMIITNSNIKSVLGHDPNNPDYNAVMDVLIDGAPSVQVLRKKPIELICAAFTIEDSSFTLILADDDGLEDEEIESLISSIFSIGTFKVNGKTFKISDYAENQDTSILVTLPPQMSLSREVKVCAPVAVLIDD